MRRRLIEYGTAIFWVVVGVHCAFAKSASPASIEFSVMAYNVENLFDVDGVALFDDYRPEVYGPRQLLTKIRNAAQVIARAEEGKAPDILLLQELERDQTPGDWSGDIARALDKFKGRALEEVLAGGWDDLASFQGLPSHVWLLQALREQGIEYPYVAVADAVPPENSNFRSVHVNVTFSKFPITDARVHHTFGARSILETVVEIAGHPLILFNNHWKAGASNPETEATRVGNAIVLRRRLDAIFAADPGADVIVAGDLNSHYNQAALFPEMPYTAVYHVLGSRGDELIIRGSEGRLLYNLWFELPIEERGSELFRGRLGTLMQILVSEGLYDFSGIQMIDNSFRVIRISGFNQHPVTGGPLRWVGAGDGAGFSDHYPVLARFRTVHEHQPERFLELSNPSRYDMGPATQPSFDYSLIDFDSLSEWTKNTQPSADRVGHLFRVDAVVVGNWPFEIGIGEHRFGIWSPNRELRDRIFRENSAGGEFSFTGEFGQHRGRWQFIVRDPSWLQNSPRSWPRSFLN